MDSRPPPPPHGTNPKSSGLPPGNYDIFIIPPHSSGSGFLYLPSLQPHRNSFLAGVACTLLAVGVWTVIVPEIKRWMSTVVASGGVGVVLLVLGVGVLGWAFGKTQLESSYAGPGGAGGSSGTGGARTGAAPQNAHETPNKNGGGNGYAPHGGPAPFASTSANGGPKPTWQQTNPGAAAAGWEKAREETRKREEERRKKEDAEKKAKETAEKDKWEKARAREKEAREKEAREKATQDRLTKEKEREEQRQAKPAAAAAAAAGSSPNTKNYQKPTAQSYVGDDDIHSFRPYDTPATKRHSAKATSQSSFYSESSSYAPSHSTARTTPPPSHRGPYATKDPDKIVLKAVYSFTDHFPKPVSQLVSGVGSVTDGLVLRMTTEGLFIDDDVRGVPQREWDVKAWTLKLVESGDHTSQHGSHHLLRASIRDAENKKYVFIMEGAEAWKVAVGLQRLRRGSQVRSLGVVGWAKGEIERVLGVLGW